MGILFSGSAIVIGGLVGTIFKRYVKTGDLFVLSIVIMLMSVLGVLVNLLKVDGTVLTSMQLPVVLFSLLVGGLLGELLHLEDRMSTISSDGFWGSVCNGFLFFGVGALQITGPIALVISNDQSQLILKSFIDFPFAITFGAVYGFGVAISGLPVMLSQAAIAAIAYLMRDFFSPELVAQISALGYVILFLMGLNLSGLSNRKVHIFNLLPSIGILILWQMIRRVL